MLLGPVVCILMFRVKGPYLSFETLYINKTIMFVLRALGGLLVTKEGSKGVQCLKEQTFLLLLSKEDAK